MHKADISTSKTVKQIGVICRANPKFSRTNPTVIRIGSTVNLENPKSVELIQIKINKAKAQSRHSGISFAPANGKLCFEQRKTFAASQNHLPPTTVVGGSAHSEVVRTLYYQ